MVRLSLLVIASFLLFSFSNEQAENEKTKWSKFKSEISGTILQFPGSYSNEFTEMNGTKKEVTKCDLDQASYYLIETTYKGDVTNHEENAQKLLNGYAAKLGGKIISESVWKIKKNKGRQAKISYSNNYGTAFYRVIFIGQKQFQVLIVSNTVDIPDEKIRKKFFNSFKP